MSKPFHVWNEAVSFFVFNRLVGDVLVKELSDYLFCEFTPKLREKVACEKHVGVRAAVVKFSKSCNCEDVVMDN